MTFTANTAHAVCIRNLISKIHLKIRTKKFNNGNYHSVNSIV